MNNFIKQIVLKRLLNKPSPKRYTISLPEKEQKHYDFVFVTGSTKEFEDIFINSWNKKIIFLISE